MSGHRFRLVLLLLALGVAFLAGHALAQELTLEWDGPDTVRCSLGVTAGTDFLVHHSSGGAQNVRVSLIDMPAGVTARFSYMDQGEPRVSPNSMSVLLQPDTELPVELTFDAAYDAHVSTYQLTLHAQLSGVPGVFANLGLVLVVWHPSVLLVEPLEDVGDEVRVLNGTNHSLSLRLTNRHPSEDRFLVTVTSTNASRGWTVEAVEGLDAVGWTPWLDFNESATARYNLTVPHSARGADATSVIFEVRSQADPDAEPRTLVVTYRVKLVANLSVELVGSHILPVVFEGGGTASVEMTFRVYNLANGADEVAIHAAPDDDGSPWLVARVLPGRLPLGSIESDYVLVNVEVQSLTPAGDYPVAVNFTSTMGDAWVLEAVVLRVPTHNRVELLCDAPSRTIDPGDAVEFHLTVRNGGNALDSYELYLRDVPPKWINYTQPNEFTLLPGEFGCFTVRIIAPSEFDEAPARTYTITIWARAPRSPANTSLALTMDLLPVYRIEWTLYGDPITSNSAPIVHLDYIKGIDPINPFSERHTVSSLPFYLRNYGNVPVNVSIMATTTEARLAVEAGPAQRLVNFDGSLFSKFSVDVPRDVPPGVYWVNVTAKCLDDPTFADRVVPLRIVVFTVDANMWSPLNVTGPGVTGLGDGAFGATDGAMLTLGLNVTNNGTSDITGLRVRINHQAPDGTWETVFEEVLDLARNETWTKGVPVYVIGEGAHRYEATIVLGNQSDPYNDMAWAVVNVTPPPAPSDGWSVGTGAVLVGALVATLVAGAVVSFVLMRRRATPPVT